MTAQQPNNRVGYITVGPSNQGKSTYCLNTLIPRLYQQRGADGLLYANADIVREELFGTAERHERAAEIWQAVYAQVSAATDKYAIIIDGTHLLPVYRAASLSALRRAGIAKTTALEFKHATLGECIRRSTAREEHRLPESEIKRHFETFVPVGPDEGFTYIVRP